MKPGLKFPLDKEALEALYITQRLNPRQIGEMIERAPSGVYRALVNYGIPLRTRSEATAMSWEGNEERRKWSSEWARKMAIQYYESGVDTRAKQYRERPGTWEQLTIDFLTELGEPFQFQVPFGKFILDFVLTNRNVCLEIDSGHHNIAHIKERDAVRDDAVRASGLAPERILAMKTQSPGYFFARLHLILERHPTMPE